MTRPIRVLHIIDGLGGGGAERWLWDIVRLSDPGRFQHRVVTACPEDPSFVFADRLRSAGAYAGSRPESRILDAMPIAGKRLLSSLLGDVPTARVNLRGRGVTAIECVRFRPDVVHGHVFHGLGLAAWLRSWTGLRFVYSPWCVPSQLRDSEAAWVIDDIRSLHHAADVIVTQPDCKRELTDLGVPRERLAMFSGQVDLEAVQRTMRDDGHRHRIRSRFGVPDHAPMALSVGRLTPVKGLGHAIDALAHVLTTVPSLHLMIVGDGAERAALEARARQLDVASHVHFAGYVEDPRPFYAAADLYVRTHLREGENSSSQDAMAFGLPVAGFDTGCGTDLIARVGHGRLARTGDPAALASAIVSLLSLPDGGRALGRAGAEYASRHLGLRLGIDLFHRIYEALHQRGHLIARRGAWSRAA